MSIKDFMSGTETEKDDYAMRVLGESINFATNLVMILGEFTDSLPDEMCAAVHDAITDYMSAVGEFVDLAAMYAAAEGSDDIDAAS